MELLSVLSGTFFSPRGGFLGKAVVEWPRDRKKAWQAYESCFQRSACASGPLRGGAVFGLAQIDEADHWIADVLTPLGRNGKPFFGVLGNVIPLFLLRMLCYFECILAG